MRGEDKETAVHGDRGGATPHYKHVIRTILVCATLVHIQARPLVGVLHVRPIAKLGTDWQRSGKAKQWMITYNRNNRLSADLN